MTRASRRGRRIAAGAGVVCLVGGLFSLGAAAASPEPAALCLPILLPCSSPTPSPSPSAPSSPLLPLPLPSPGDTPPTEPSPSPTKAVPDPSAPTFTLPAAQLGGSSISFSGLRSVELVTVPLANGTRTPVLKISADSIAITDFMLDVRKATGPALVSTADRMELRGHVRVFVDSATGTLPDGTGITLGADTPPPGDELPPRLLRVNLGLVGVLADSIEFADSHQQMK